LKAATDPRPYEDLTRNLNRINPIVATPDLVSGTHGTDERVRADDWSGPRASSPS